MTHYANGQIASFNTCCQYNNRLDYHTASVPPLIPSAGAPGGPPLFPPKSHNIGGAPFINYPNLYNENNNANSPLNSAYFGPKVTFYKIDEKPSGGFLRCNYPTVVNNSQEWRESDPFGSRNSNECYRANFNSSCNGNGNGNNNNTILDFPPNTSIFGNTVHRGVDSSQYQYPPDLHQNGNNFCCVPQRFSSGDCGDFICENNNSNNNNNNNNNTNPVQNPNIFIETPKLIPVPINTDTFGNTDYQYGNNQYHIVNPSDQVNITIRSLSEPETTEIQTSPIKWHSLRSIQSVHQQQQELLQQLREFLELKQQELEEQKQNLRNKTQKSRIDMSRINARSSSRARDAADNGDKKPAKNANDSATIPSPTLDTKWQDTTTRTTNKTTLARHAQRPTLRNLNPVFRRREKKEDNDILSQLLLKNARRSGSLNLSNRGLATVPTKVFDINESDPDVKVSLEELSVKEEDAWWNQVPLNNLDLSSNQLTKIPSSLGKLTSLTCLTFRDNGLTAIPKEIGKLEHLVRLNLSRNHLKDLPLELFTLPDLRYLNLSNNEFEELDPAISDLHMLEILDVSNNHLKSLPCGIGFLVKVTTLLLSFNCLKELPVDIVDMRSLQKLDLTHNELTSLPENMGNLRKLQFLYAQHNDIVELPMFDGCTSLQELYLSNNYLESLPDNFYTELPNLKILDLRDNRITQISEDVCLLQGLVRLDISNNTVSQLPNSLSALAHLVNLQVDGNPIRNIRSNILQCGTQRILRVLRSRISLQSFDQSEAQSSVTSLKSSEMSDGLNSPRSCRPQQSEDSIFPDKYKLRKTRCLSVTMQQLTEVPSEVFQLAAQENVNIVDFSRNRLDTLPESLCLMKDNATELTFANNLISYVPSFISDFSRLSIVNLSCNNLSDLPPEFGALKTLRELVISNNRFEYLPHCVYELDGLEVLLAPNNRIKGVDATDAGLARLKRLATLDLRNNNIEQVPPILGKLHNITCLEIVGNPFKLPRHQTLEKGTEAIMSYLRDRIPS